MSRNLNNQEIQWLQTEPQRLLTHYQFIIEGIVINFIRKGFFQSEEKEDLIQAINLQLLEGKLEKIRHHFNGSVYLRTYFSKVIYNTCLEMVRQRKRQVKTIDMAVLYRAESDRLNAYENLIIREEMYRLEAILKGLGRTRIKAQLCLKLVARIILQMVDIQFYVSPKTTEEIKMIKGYFFREYHHLTDREVFGIIIKLYNKIEKKDTEADSLRKWVYQLLERIIDLLNGGTSPCQFDKESMKILLQYYFLEDFENH